MKVAEYAGLRYSEIMHLKKEKLPWKAYTRYLPGKDYGDVPDSYVDWENQTIVIEQSKSGKSRRVPMRQSLLECLEPYRVSGKSPFLFCGPDGKPIASVKTAFNATVRRAGIKV